MNQAKPTSPPPARLDGGLIGAAMVLLLISGWHCAVHEPEELSAYSLQGAHVDLTCSDCHVDGFEASITDSCTACHEEERPNAHWDDECDECHEQDRWDGVPFDHDEWELDGAHLDVACVQCHAYTFEVGDDCSDCHTSMPHTDYGGDCDDCHTTESWHDLDVDHGDFPMTCAHEDADCTECHVGGYDNASPWCQSCHNPPNGHYTSNCDNCHDPCGW